MDAPIYNIKSNQFDQLNKYFLLLLLLLYSPTAMDPNREVLISLKLWMRAKRDMRRPTASPISMDTKRAARAVTSITKKSFLSTYMRKSRNGRRVTL